VADFVAWLPLPRRNGYGVSPAHRMGFHYRPASLRWPIRNSRAVRELNSIAARKLGPVKRRSLSGFSGDTVRATTASLGGAVPLQGWRC